jgi:hypothetical protein
MPCYSPLKGFVNTESGGIVFKRGSNAGANMEVACGQCLGCRLDKSKEWAMRIVHESSLHDENCFLTLTYDDEHVPADGSLNKKHFQDFMKRLRWRYPEKKIRYYQCGEYGEKYGRPHYHACMFGIDFNDAEVIAEVRPGQILRSSPALEQLWPFGFNTIGSLTYESAAYCSRYVLKKVNGKQAEDHYMRVDDYGICYWVEPEYTTMSRRPGIGKGWFEKYGADVFPSDEVPVPGKGILKGVPRYYDELLRLENEDTYEEVKEARKQYYFSHPGEFLPARLEAKYKVRKAGLELFTRRDLE